RIDAIVDLEHVGRNRLAANAAEAVTTRNEVTRQLTRLSVHFVMNDGTLALQAFDPGDRRVVDHLAAGTLPRIHQVCHDLMLRIDDHRASPGDLSKVDAM